MNFIKIFIAAFSATNVMTTFSYLLSHRYKTLFTEPVLLNYALNEIDMHPKGKLRNLSGWLAHYAIGLVFVVSYEMAWRLAGIPFNLWTGVGFGIISGFIGILGWKMIFFLPHKKPKVTIDDYYIPLFFAHIVFAIAVVVAFKIFAYDPMEKLQQTVTAFNK
jgi:hypothetical protein